MSRYRDLRVVSGVTAAEVVVCLLMCVLLLAFLTPMLAATQVESRAATCLQNLRAQGRAQGMYIEDNDGVFPSGLMTNVDPNQPFPPTYEEFGTVHLAYLPYMGYENEFGAPEDLWISDGIHQGEKHPELTWAFRSIPEYQCPQHPNPATALNYLSNAMRIPFPRPPSPTPALISFRNVQRLASKINLAQYVYITETHVSLGPPQFSPPHRYHQFFSAEHIPYASRPRIANDPRHPFDGLFCLFFDGHAEAKPLHLLDPGWPTPIEERLRWFAPLKDSTATTVTADPISGTVQSFGP